MCYSLFTSPWNSSQTSKLRVVYDGSTRAIGDEYSLNDCLQKGPNYITKLIDILIRFRWNYVAIMADIEKAFLVIRTCETDRDVLCFCGSSNPVLLHQIWFTFVSQDRCLDCVHYPPYWVPSLNIIFIILRNAA